MRPLFALVAAALLAQGFYAAFWSEAHALAAAFSLVAAGVCFMGWNLPDDV